MSRRLTRALCRLIVLALTMVAAVVSTHSAFAQFAEKKKLTLAAAQKMVAAAQAEAERNHLAGVIAVVDDGGWPILVLRMDNSAYLASVELAPGKARTAALFKKPSKDLEDAINHGRTAAVTAGDFVAMQGGLPMARSSVVSARVSIPRLTKGYAQFDQGIAAKFVLDPHGLLPKTA